MSIFSAARKGLGSAAKNIDAWGAARGAKTGFLDTYGAAPLSKALGWASRQGTVGLSTMAGGLAGGAYGAFSDDTSILGGMAKGAAIGAGVGVGGVGARAYGKLRAGGFGAGKAASGAFKILGRRAGRFIGRSFGSNKTYGKINGLK